ncbi:phage terminase small subunit P27 family [Aurantiacibacter arachoides]|uniref:phage terminase small subunit P27 family n=1 Tax=Aurantiacibacter arachoides TaxID=1850444 RepID=UPI0035714282
MPPEWLTRAQLEIWEHGLASLPPGLFKAADRELYLSWVFAVDLRNQAAQKLTNSSLLVRSATGNIALSPYQRMLNQQTVIMKSLCAEFGFSPAARTGIVITEEVEEDPTDRFFS